MSESSNKNNKFVVAIHGGAGVIEPNDLTPEKAEELHEALKHALLAGQSVLANGGCAVDAAESAVMSLEDSPLFNAGKGSVFTHEEGIEMDASVMDGRDLNAGAVANVSNIKNPIKLAKEIMYHSQHVMLAGPGAEEYASLRGIETEAPDYFKTEFRLEQLQLAKKLNRVQLDHSTDETNAGSVERQLASEDPDFKFGTVGAVALDMNGNLAAATSTGGMTNKRWSRVGDSSIIGCGTYADNASCAVSATGHGEYFIRATVARSISALMEYKGISLQEAADEVVMKKLVNMQGEGGIVAVDKDGNVALTFNTIGMYRGYINSDGVIQTGMFKEDVKSW
jgi:beta-aspartyl-peptidase (threonine type)